MKSTIEYADAVQRVCKAHANRVAFLVGAGISMERQSYLPDWNSMVLAMLEEIAGEEGKAEVDDVKEHVQLLFNEVILHFMKGIVGSDAAVEALNACLRTDSYSAIHKFLAWSANEFNSAVLTTNFDGLIETAGANPERVLPLHGCLSKPAELRFTVEDIFSASTP